MPNSGPLFVARPPPITTERTGVYCLPGIGGTVGGGAWLKLEVGDEICGTTSGSGVTCSSIVSIGWLTMPETGGREGAANNQADSMGLVGLQIAPPSILQQINP